MSRLTLRAYISDVFDGSVHYDDYDLREYQYYRGNVFGIEGTLLLSQGALPEYDPIRLLKQYGVDDSGSVFVTRIDRRLITIKGLIHPAIPLDLFFYMKGFPLCQTQ